MGVTDAPTVEPTAEPAEEPAAEPAEAIGAVTAKLKLGGVASDNFEQLEGVFKEATATQFSMPESSVVIRDVQPDGANNTRVSVVLMNWGGLDVTSANFVEKLNAPAFNSKFVEMALSQGLEKLVSADGSVEVEGAAQELGAHTLQRREAYFARDK